ncbi:MAG: DsbA family protein [Gammaproteobacteria bacterium]|jgi:predicted DsbA family dithiol-disulfide isomerase
MTGKPTLRLAVLSDYICPFCYIGFLRLEKLREHYDLAVNWALVEIHPESPPEGKPVEQLGYTRPHLDKLLQQLDELAHSEGVELAPHSFTTNSHKALLLAEASKQHGAEIFYTLHRRLFESFLLEGRNIGDSGELETLADECGVPHETLTAAWTDPAYEERLRHNLVAATQAGATGTPTFFIGEKQLTGAVSVNSLMAAAEAATGAEGA